MQVTEVTDVLLSTEKNGSPWGLLQVVAVDVEATSIFSLHPISQLFHPSQNVYEAPQAQMAKEHGRTVKTHRQQS
jgi:hypothetical protein